MKTGDKVYHISSSFLGYDNIYYLEVVDILDDGFINLRFGDTIISTHKKYVFKTKNKVKKGIEDIFKRQLKSAEDNYKLKRDMLNNNKKELLFRFENID